MCITILCVPLQYQNKQTMKKSKKQTVKILGQTVTVGTKLHAKLVEQVRLFNQIPTNER